jgi:uncharacterized protein involved in exopolysaccharide biosynthesis
MEREEQELLRQRIEFLEEILAACQERIAALEARVAVLEGRPVAVGLTDERVKELVRQVTAGEQILLK